VCGSENEYTFAENIADETDGGGDTGVL